MLSYNPHIKQQIFQIIIELKKKKYNFHNMFSKLSIKQFLVIKWIIYNKDIRV